MNIKYLKTSDDLIKYFELALKNKIPNFFKLSYNN